MKKIALILGFICLTIAVHAQAPEESFRRGLAKLKKDDIPGAIKEFDKAITAKKDYLDAIFNRGTAKMALKDYKAAIEDFDMALKIDPDFSSATLNKAASKGYLKDYNGGIGDLDMLIENRPNFAKAYALRGKMKSALKEKDGACEDYNKAWSLGDQSVKGMVSLACAKGGKVPPQLKETYVIASWPDSVTWQMAKRQDAEDAFTTLMFKKPENDKNWTVMGTLSENPELVDFSLDKAMMQVVDELKKNCPQGVVTEVERDTKTEFAYIVFVFNCPKGISEVIQLVKGYQNVYVNAFSNRKEVFSEDAGRTWASFFRDGKIEYKAAEKKAGE